jgi:hypothetical protein
MQPAEIDDNMPLIRRGIVTMCMGDGQGIALALKVV